MWEWFKFLWKGKLIIKIIIICIIDYFEVIKNKVIFGCVNMERFLRYIILSDLFIE